MKKIKKNFICFLLVFVVSMVSMPLASVFAATNNGIETTLLKTLQCPTKGVYNINIYYLQLMLNKFPCVNPKIAFDGKWGTETQTAVAKFQASTVKIGWSSKNSFPTNGSYDGIVGPVTATAIVQAALAICYCTMEHPLNSSYWNPTCVISDPGIIDGQFGTLGTSNTSRAVINFQKYRGYATQINYVDANIWGTLANTVNALKF